MHHHRHYRKNVTFHDFRKFNISKIDHGNDPNSKIELKMIHSDEGASERFILQNIDNKEAVLITRCGAKGGQLLKQIAFDMNQCCALFI